MQQRAPRASDEAIGDLIDHAVDLTVRFLSDRADLTASAAFALNRLHREGPLRLTTLASREGISQPSMTQLIQRLERHDLVAKIPDPHDGRVAMVGITDEGVALIDARLGKRRERLDRLLALADDEDYDALVLASRVALPVLRRLIATAEAQPGCTDPPGPAEAPTDDRGERA